MGPIMSIYGTAVERLGFTAPSARTCMEVAASATGVRLTIWVRFCYGRRENEIEPDTTPNDGFATPAGKSGVLPGDRHR